MYKILDNIAEELEGDVVQMICFNSSQIYIHFESTMQIAIEGQYLLQKDGIKKMFEVYPISGDNGLLEFLEKKITDVTISDSKHDLTIHFNDESISFLGSDTYESYTIRIGGKTIVI